MLIKLIMLIMVIMTSIFRDDALYWFCTIARKRVVVKVWFVLSHNKKFTPTDVYNAFLTP